MPQRRNPSLPTRIIEAANRAEATALLMRLGYQVYRPEADVDGEDLVVKTPRGKLRAVQLKSCPVVNRKYSGKNIWMLFPCDKYQPDAPREWFLIQHDRLFDWMQTAHGHTISLGQNGGWAATYVSKELRAFVKPSRVK